MLFIVNGNGVPSVASIVKIAPTIVTLDAPTANQTLLQPFVLGGWAIDQRSSSGTGVDTVHVWAFPAAGGNPIFCGASYGGSRPDVGAVYGARYSNSGFTILVRGLPEGAYNFIAYAHSTVTGIFDTTNTVSNVTVKAQPLLAIDTPGPNATVPHAFNVGGWAIDYGAASGTGVNTIHVWAAPAGGGSPVFAGVVAYGGARPDVGAIYGAQFTNSGYNLIINSLPAGTWDLFLFPYSTVNNYFFPATQRRVTILP
jgi:hypothetical protein